MIEPSTINPLTLPSVPLEMRSHLPRTGAIYFVINAQDAIQYIGLSKNLWQRWTNHHTLTRLRKSQGVRLAWVDISDISLLESLESALIEWFNPPLNKSPKTVFHKIGLRIRQVKEIEIKGLGERIKQARLGSDKSLEQICDEVGVSRTYWYDVEKETLKGALSIENLRKIEEVLRVDFGISLEGESDV